MKEKIVLIGAGSAMFTRGVVADLCRRKQETDLALVDVNPEGLAVAEKLARKITGATGSPITLRADTDHRNVLRGATVVVCTIGVGGRRAWEEDVLIPRKYGIYQPVGDTVMVGGASRALRMIPVMVEIAEDVLNLAPNALFFNYGNPMAPICRAVRKATGAPIIGLCHGVHQMAGYLAGVLGVPMHAVTYTATGLNHLTWFSEMRVGGEDVFPQLREMARDRAGLSPQEYSRQFPGEAASGIGVEGGAGDNPFSWQLFDLFGAFPAVGDRHISEFFPRYFPEGKYFGRTLGVDAFSFEQTVAYGDRLANDTREAALSDAPLPPEYYGDEGGEHEQLTSILDAIRSGKSEVYSVNLLNRGQIPNLPEEAIVETPAITTADGLRPVMQKPLPAGIAGTLATHCHWVETIVEAALEGSREKFVQALLLDGSITSTNVAGNLADELLETQSRFLPQFVA